MEALNHPQFTEFSWVDDFLIKTIKIIIISSFKFKQPKLKHHESFKENRMGFGHLSGARSL